MKPITVPTFHLRRSDRAKKTRIVVTHDKIEVVAPHHVSEQKIQAFVIAQRDWIDNARRRVSERTRQTPSLAPLHYETGAKIPYRGQQLTLTIEISNIKSLRIHQPGTEQICVYLPATITDTERQQAIKLGLKNWMKHQARQHATLLIQRHGQTFNLEPRSLRIKTQKSRWGSCGPKNDINLNWLLMLAPPEILEYVVVHELCHIRHKNHSQEFWGLVAAHMPEYHLHRQWLKQHGASIMQGL